MGDGERQITETTTDITEILQGKLPGQGRWELSTQVDTENRWELKGKNTEERDTEAAMKSRC